MTPFENFVSFIFQINIWFVIKTVFLIAIGIYFVFSMMVLREVELMIKTLKSVFNWPIKIITWLHVLLVILVFLFAWSIL